MQLSKLAILCAAFASFTAFAGGPSQVALPVGHSTTLSLPAPVADVKLDDPSLVEVKRAGRTVTFVGRSVGTTDVVIRMRGSEHHFQLYVASDRHAMP